MVVLSSILRGNILFLGALQEDVQSSSLFVVDRECDEESSSDAGIDGRGAQRPVFLLMSIKRWVTQRPVFCFVARPKPPVLKCSSTAVVITYTYIQSCHVPLHLHVEYWDIFVCTV